ncbi:MAG: acetyl-CoA carboxylase biotin carboxylase subunit [Candidatus Eisenbacteria bacterium]|uniref:Acetyl-CoA carboxylase biotin carboxylase subunit n=1 Tax=Eiseniibacteriota bacterium TaxID=2212470 RepID=A0A948W3Q8_UNCEI|nr:acetyl-CoA carboxylase biotin carboxylase subunit [Candidatus Eisenbacteria bacterium]MBU1947111.1 acetyl-CoA carboxylase biotin carboxylase subunit [Candidatus Eisenbacteria bacterium]MBU2691357.1 acetyl-CoA carboxylase biotin carboxylase subunit [Candidatus Eisenbacteria bacterium]
MRKLLVANRGEIAVRILRGAREMGWGTVAVYSEADSSSLHVQVADEAVCIGAPEPAASYLNMDAILQAAKETGAGALHPGYGFLAENAQLASRCLDAGITFVGPSPSAISTMGNKVAARDIMGRAGVPIVPGTQGKDQSVAALVAEAQSIKPPLLVKAAGGGGGKGMRVVKDHAGLAAAIREAQQESGSAFGDSTVYVEKFLEEPRHIEFQILADQAGKTVHLFERECSIQRRHQKIIEETPSTAVSPQLRARMGEAAVAAAKAVGYINAGTVEFLLDRDGSFYFLEMNTRLQVEHPVTELIAGLDLVHWQLRIANGEGLSFDQKDLVQKGHSIEARIYAEDPAHGFRPSMGKILLLREPDGPGIRVDSGIYEGYEVSPYYDPILAKLIVWGENRETASRRIIQALDQYIILGIRPNIPFLRDVVAHPAFAAGETTTDFLPLHFPDWGREAKKTPPEAFLAAALGEALGRVNIGSLSATEAPNPWDTVGSWEIGSGL